MQPVMLPTRNLPGDTSIYGVHSLAGNVSDWNVDHDPMGLGHRNLRGVRGGYWSIPSTPSRSAYRDILEDFVPVITASIRVVRKID